ncbi:hypothetical protein AGMMS50230_12800 [Spirochaetia bacterium]|nr:hypothetical protein AGMMS50230_12800 [Spirochaetia bacterium]
MAFCIHCGKEMNDGVKFCPSCGKPAGETAAPAAAPQPAIVPKPAAKELTEAEKAAKVLRVLADTIQLSIPDVGFLGLGDRSALELQVQNNVMKAYKAGERSITALAQAAVEGVKPKEAVKIQSSLLSGMQRSNKNLGFEP